MLYWCDQVKYGARETLEGAGVSLDPGVIYMLYEQIARRLSGQKAALKQSDRFRLKTAGVLGTSYLEILEAVEEAYYETDLKGNITFCNAAAFRLLGYHEDEFIGSNYREFYQKPRAALAAFSHVYRTGKPNKAFMAEMIKKDGTSFYGELSIIPVRDAAGKICGFRGVGRDVTRRKLAEEQLKYLSLHDQLTGLYNRTYFEGELRRLNNSREYPITIISLDLNGLKLINDSMGHAEGDRLLVNCARLLREPLRRSDILARIGGDEFVILLPRTDIEAGAEIAVRIETAVEKYNARQPRLPLGVALGAATRDTPSKQGLEETFKKADDVMYARKVSTKDKVPQRVLASLRTALRERDWPAGEHREKAQSLCRRLGRKAGLASRQLENLELLFHMHDLGNVLVPDLILFKEGPLTDREWEIIRRHPEKGYRIALSFAPLHGIAPLILKHQERWDGRGYPEGLSGEKIPLECRVFAVVDTFAVMTGRRPSTRRQLSREAALKEIRTGAGSQFDPRLVEKFTEIIDFDLQEGLL